MTLKPVAPEGAAEACQSLEARIWLDLQDFKSSELEAWLDKLGVRDLACQLCLEALDRPGFYPLKNEIFFVVRIIPEAQNTCEADHIAFLCRENLEMRSEYLALDRVVSDQLPCVHGLSKTD